MGKRIVIALGGNALGKNLEEQMHAVKTTASAIADLIEDGHEVVIAHGNGPQVGMIQNAFAAYHKQQAKSDIMPLSMCVAMSQGYIGYQLSQAILNDMKLRGIDRSTACVVTQTVVAAAEYGADEQLAAQGAAISTLACFVVTPVLMLLL